MSHLPLRSHDAKSLLPREIRDIPFKGRVADCLGLFGLLVIVLGLTCLLSGDPMSMQDSARNPMSVQESSDLQSLVFFFLGIGQLLFLRKKLPVLLSKRVNLFSREGWYYIGVLSALLVVLLFLLYLFIDSSHLSMVGVCLCAFLLPFTVSNAWEIFRDRRAQAAAERKKIPMRAVLLSGASLLLLVGLMSLTGRQTAAPPRPNPEPSPKRSAGREARYEEAGRVLSAYTSHLLELDARFSRLAQKDTADSPADLAKAREDIKAQEYALGHLLDSLDSRGQGLSLLTTPIRSLLGGHRILSRLQDKQHQDYEVKPQPDSFRDLSSLP
jgi:hypothetical protein